MIDLSKTIEAKSDHLSADDLVGASKTITITGVSVNNTDRPVVIDYIGGEGKSYLPCKSMRRVLVAVWGVNGSDYVGQSLTLYRDNSVKFGGQEVGGIRISHITGIDKPLNLSLAVSRGKKSVFVVKPLIKQAPVPEKPLDEICQEIEKALSIDDLKIIAKKYSQHSQIEDIKPALTARKEYLAMSPEEQEINHKTAYTISTPPQKEI